MTAVLERETTVSALDEHYTKAIESVLTQFKINAKISGKTRGPSVTRYELTLGKGVGVEKFDGKLAKNFAYATASESVRILAPIPGKSAVGIELPNERRDMVALDEVLAANPDDGHPLSVGLGKTLDGQLMMINLQQMPHLLVAGTTGAGKSTFINAMLVSLLKRATPQEVKLLLIDPKMVELTPYNGAEHLLRPVITEVNDAIEALEWLVEEMESRYRVMKDNRARHIDDVPGYPYIVCVVDELADLMMTSGKAVESLIVRLAQKARAAGIHLVLATQRPSVDVVTGLIKTNVPSRLSFATSSAIDSRVILDEAGAEQLLGMGDALYKPVGARSAIRVQSAFVSDAEIEVERQVVLPVVESPLVQVAMVTDYIERLQGQTNAAIAQVNSYLSKITSMKDGPRRMEAFADAPRQLGIAGCSLVDISEGLKWVRNEGIPLL